MPPASLYVTKRIALLSLAFVTIITGCGTSTKDTTSADVLHKSAPITTNAREINSTKSDITKNKNDNKNQNPNNDEQQNRSVNTVGGTLLTVSASPATPSEGYIPPNANEAPIFRMRLQSNSSAPIRIDDLYLVVIDAENQRPRTDIDTLVSHFALDGAGATQRVTPNKGVLRFSFPQGNSNLNSSPFVLQPNSNAELTIKVASGSITTEKQTGKGFRLSTISPPHDLATPQYGNSPINGVVAYNLSNNKQLTERQLSVNAVSQPHAIVKTIFRMENVSPSSTQLSPDGTILQEIFRFTITNNGPGDFDVGKVSLEVSGNRVNISDMQIFSANNLTTPLNTKQKPALNASAGQVSQVTPLMLDSSSPASGFMIPRGTTQAFVLKALVSTGVETGFGVHSVGVRLVDEVCKQSVTTFSGLQRQSCAYAWSDISARSHGLTNPSSADWMPMSYVPELPTLFVNRSLTN